MKANLVAWVNDILRNELSYLLLFSVDHNHVHVSMFQVTDEFNE